MHYFYQDSDSCTIDYADSVLCDFWLVLGKAYGFEFSTLRDCYAIYHGVGSSIYASGLFPLFIRFCFKFIVSWRDQALQFICITVSFIT